MSTLKELRQQIRVLRKLKKETRVGSEERRNINKQIRDLRKQVEQTGFKAKPTESKQSLIDELMRVYRLKGRPVLVDFRYYTDEQLQTHLDKLK